MKEPIDLLETELLALLPQEPSQDLRQAVARRLANSVVASASRSWLNRAKATRLALAGGLIAAVLMLAFNMRRQGIRFPEQHPAIVVLTPAVATAFDQTLPSLWQYCSGLREGGNLDALLDRHSQGSRDAHFQETPTRGFGPFVTKLNNLPGEL